MDAPDHINVFDVVPTKDEVWVLAVDGKVVEVTDARLELIETALALANKFRPSRLVVRGQDGEIASITPFSQEDGYRT